jgi:hypothetical protein
MYNIRKRIRDFTVVLGLWGMLTAPYASAVITPIPSPVVGSLTETWESFPNFIDNPDTYLTDPTTIMGGGASISSPVMAVYEPGAGAYFGLGDSGYAQVSAGAKGMGIDMSAATATITFTNPVPNFGAFWGAVTGGIFNLPSPATVTVSFFDVLNQPIGTEQFTYVRPDDGALEWHGWASTVGIAATVCKRTRSSPNLGRSLSLALDSSACSVMAGNAGSARRRYFSQASASRRERGGDTQTTWRPPRLGR